MRSFDVLEVINDLYTNKQITANAVKMLVKKLCTKKAIKQYKEYLEDEKRLNQFLEGV